LVSGYSNQTSENGGTMVAIAASSGVTRSARRPCCGGAAGAASSRRCAPVPVNTERAKTGGCAASARCHRDESRGRRFGDDVAGIAAHIAGNAGAGRGGDAREIGQRLGLEPGAALRDNM
jgi:hypothetical protein